MSTRCATQPIEYPAYPLVRGRFTPFAWRGAVPDNFMKRLKTWKPKKRWNSMQYTQSLLNYRQKQLKRKITFHEKLVYAALKKLGLTFKFQKGWICYGGIRISDFYLPHPYNIAIEVDGPDHVQKEDELREEQILKNHPRVQFLRITNSKVEDLELKNLLSTWLIEEINVLNFRNSNGDGRLVGKVSYSEKIARSSKRKEDATPNRTVRDIGEGLVPGTL